VIGHIGGLNTGRGHLTMGYFDNFDNFDNEFLNKY
jgi:hypothetical protein